MSYDPYTGQYVAGSSDQYYGNPVQPQSQEPWQYEEGNADNFHQSQQELDDTNEIQRPDFESPNYEDEFGNSVNREDDYGDYGYSKSASNDHGDNPPNYGYEASSYPPLRRQLTEKSMVGSSRSKPSVEIAPVPVPVTVRENAELAPVRDGFDQGEFTPVEKRRTPSAYRQYRYDHQGRLWTKGGIARTIGRFCVCSTMTILFLVLSIGLTLALWLRPPNIQIGNVKPNSQSGSVLQKVGSGGFQVNMGVDISVDNFNYFDVALKRINLEITYPIDDIAIGGGTTTDITLKKGTETNFTFPFSLTYDPLVDASGRALADILQKCGSSSGQRGTLSVNYKIMLGIRMFIVTVSPVVSNVFEFTCPFKSTDLTKLIS